MSITFKKKLSKTEMKLLNDWQWIYIEDWRSWIDLQWVPLKISFEKIKHLYLFCMNNEYMDKETLYLDKEMFRLAKDFYKKNNKDFIL